METFSERKKVQKAVYLLDKTFKMNFGFKYGWYLHGQYSTEVTKLVFDVVERHQPVNSNPDNLTIDDQRKITSLLTFLKEDINSNDQLELLASVYYLLTCSGYSKSKVKEVVEFMHEKKPYFDEQEVYKAIMRLQPLIDR